MKVHTSAATRSQQDVQWWYQPDGCGDKHGREYYESVDVLMPDYSGLVASPIPPEFKVAKIERGSASCR